MIVYEPFWQTLKRKNLTTYNLINDFHLSSSTISRLRNNKGITTATINDLCRILECKVEDVLQYLP